MNMVQVWSDGKDTQFLGLINMNYEEIRHRAGLNLPVVTISNPVSAISPYSPLSPVPETHHISLKLDIRSVAMDMADIRSGNLEIYMRFNIPSYAEPFHRLHDDRKVLTWKVAVVDLAVYEELFDLDIFSPDGEDVMAPHGYAAETALARATESLWREVAATHAHAKSPELTGVIFDESSHISDAMWKDAAAALVASKANKPSSLHGSTRLSAPEIDPKKEDSRYHWASYNPDVLKYVPAITKKQFT